jgi:4-hydroxybenzoyl-CoA reductase subunit alpha
VISGQEKRREKMKEYSVVGKGFPRIEAMEKATGELKYVTDLTLPRMLYGKLLRSPYPHALIKSINTSKAEQLPGVKGVLTGKDTLGVEIGGITGSRDRTPLAYDKVRYIGEAVAAVAAIDEDTALEALDLIEVDYEQLPAVFTFEESSKEGAPLIHDDRKGNVCLERHWNFGDVEKGFAESDYVREDRFYMPAHLHGFLEPYACLALWEASGKYTIWTGVQIPFRLRRELARALGTTEGKVRVVKGHMGGGFGGKNQVQDLHLACALLAKKCRRPVKIVYTMKEQITAGLHRVPTILDLKTGVKKDGTIVAQSTRLQVESGAYMGAAAITSYNHGLAHMLPYRLPNFKMDIYRVFTNVAQSGPKRGHGQSQVHHAVECQLDMIAEAIGIDPVDIRLRNALQTGDVTVNGFRISSCGLTESIEKATRKAGWKEKRARGKKGYGIGIGCGGFPSGIRDSSLSDAGAVIKLNADGGVILFTGAADMGQGCNTILGQIVAEVLGIELNEVTVVAGDTELCPYTPGAVGSTTTWFAGNAVKLAAQDVKRQLAEGIAGKLGTEVDDIEFKEHEVYSKKSPDKKMSYYDVVSQVQVSAVKGIIIGKASYYPPNVEWPDPKRSYYGNISGGYSFSTQVAEVEVDLETGEVTLLDMTLGDDCGYPMNVLSATGQVEGSVSNAQGETLYEELLFEKGAVVNSSFANYKMPTAPDTPHMETIHIITDDPGGPFGAKEIGEGFIVSGYGAIANAIYDATGVWVKDLPITPQKIRKALKEKGGKGNATA